MHAHDGRIIIGDLRRPKFGQVDAAERMLSRAPIRSLAANLMEMSGGKARCGIILLYKVK